MIALTVLKFSEACSTKGKMFKSTHKTCLWHDLQCRKLDQDVTLD
jgi:hypothetical protein